MHLEMNRIFSLNNYNGFGKTKNIYKSRKIIVISKCYKFSKNVMGAFIMEGRS